MEAIAAWSLKPPPFPEEPLPRGEGRIVMVLPGFLSGDWTTGRLRDFLRSLDYRVETPEILFNAGPTKSILARLDAKVASLVEESEGPIHLVGISLGGVLARHLALRNPSTVRCVVTLCSPIRFPVTTPLQPFAVALAPFLDEKWVARRDEISQSLTVPVTAVYTEDDGIVDWRQCLQDETDMAKNLRVSGAHMTIGSNPEAQRATALALAAADRTIS
jgi:esterase/lipase